MSDTPLRRAIREAMNVSHLTNVYDRAIATSQMRSMINDIISEFEDIESLHAVTSNYNQKDHVSRNNLFIERLKTSKEESFKLKARSFVKRCITLPNTDYDVINTSDPSVTAIRERNAAEDGTHQMILYKIEKEFITVTHTSAEFMAGEIKDDDIVRVIFPTNPFINADSVELVSFWNFMYVIWKEFQSIGNVTMKTDDIMRGIELNFKELSVGHFNSIGLGDLVSFNFKTASGKTLAFNTVRNLIELRNDKLSKWKRMNGVVEKIVEKSEGINMNRLQGLFSSSIPSNLSTRDSVSVDSCKTGKLRNAGSVAGNPSVASPAGNPSAASAASSAGKPSAAAKPAQTIAQTIAKSSLRSSMWDNCYSDNFGDYDE